MFAESSLGEFIVRKFLSALAVLFVVQPAALAEIKPYVGGGVSVEEVKYNQTEESGVLIGGVDFNKNFSAEGELLVGGALDYGVSALAVGKVSPLEKLNLHARIGGFVHNRESEIFCGGSLCYTYSPGSALYFGLAYGVGAEYQIFESSFSTRLDMTFYKPLESSGKRYRSNDVDSWKALSISLIYNF